MSIKPSLTIAQDSYIWYPLESGTYSAKSGYKIATETSLHLEPAPANQAHFSWYKNIWNVACSPKLKLLAWKVLHQALPTGYNLQRRGLLSNTSCVHCGKTETSDHLFLHCAFAAQVWELVPLKTTFCSTACASFISALEGSRLWICLPPTGVSGDIFFWIIWALWTTRNQLILESRHTSPLNVVTKAIASAQEWTLAQIAEKQHTNPTRDLGLASPRSIPTGTMICNTDASWNPTTTSVGLGWIFNTQDSLPQQGCQSQTLVQSVIQAEGLVIRSALSYTIHLGFTKIWLRSDSLGIINAINSITKPKNLHGVLSDIENLSSCFHLCFFFVPREQNGPADCVAKASLCNMTSSWV